MVITRNNLVNICLFQVNSRDIRKRCVCSSQFTVLVLLSWTLNIFYSFFLCLYHSVWPVDRIFFILIIYAASLIIFTLFEKDISNFFNIPTFTLASTFVFVLLSICLPSNLVVWAIRIQISTNIWVTEP